MHAHYYTLICNWCHFLNLIFCNVRFSHPDAPRMCVWGGGRGGAEIFIYIRRLGPFLGVQNLEFQYFWGVSEISVFLGV